MGKDSRVPNAAEGGLSDKEHVDEADRYAESWGDGVNVETGRKGDGGARDNRKGR